MPQQLLHPPQVKPEPDKVDGMAVPERMKVDVNIDHPAVLLDDVPDLLSLEVVSDAIAYPFNSEVCMVETLTLCFIPKEYHNTGKTHT
jgi:hypothetical protein